MKRKIVSILAMPLTRGLGFVVAVVILVAIGSDLLGPAGSDPQNIAIRRSAIPAVLLWSLAVLDYQLRSGRDFRVLYALGCAFGIVHVAIAFHLGHAWSHAAAFEHTERASGFGLGIFVNYAFILIWIGDALWACLAWDRYRMRPRWLHRTVLGFMWFILFNAAVAFAGGPMRWVNAAVLLAVLASLFTGRGLRPVRYLRRKWKLLVVAFALVALVANGLAARHARAFLVYSDAAEPIQQPEQLTRWQKLCVASRLRRPVRKGFPLLTKPRHHHQRDWSHQCVSSGL